ncbi:hypothetical protein MEO43_03880 [Dolichospermum sp. ST_sed5]|nr:hypothetical protein [Dolichospermum sp. ST_sed7]MDD1464463.1 hypothetical protein [Dolichospermum sp. ST_sed5]
MRGLTVFPVRVKVKTPGLDVIPMAVSVAVPSVAVTVMLGKREVVVPSVVK